MNKVLIFGLPLLSFYCLRAQNLERVNRKIEKEWSGNLVLNNDQKFYCNFVYNPLMEGGMLVVKTDSTTNLYPPEKVQSFNFYDEDQRMTRQFYSLPIRPDAIKRYFFELVHESDRISLLGSNTIINKNGSRENQSDLSKLSSDLSVLRYGKKTVTKTKVKADYKRYLLDHRSGMIYSFSRKKFLELIGDSSETLNYMYQKHYHLNENDLHQYVELIDIYSKANDVR